MVCAVSLCLWVAQVMSDECVYMCVCVCICMHQIICMHSDRKGTVQKQITDDRCLCDCIKLARHIREKKSHFQIQREKLNSTDASTFSRCQNSVVYTIYIHKNSLVNMSTYRLSLSRSLSLSLSLFLSFSLSLFLSQCLVNGTVCYSFH